MQNDYTYDLAGMRQDNAVREAGTLTRTEEYGYDELYRLKTVNYGENSHTQTYAFDAMGNRTQKQDSLNGTDNYTYNNANMLLTRGANNYSNDVNGNTLTGGGRTNTWDSQNRLVQCVYNSNTSTFTYGADGIRHRSVVNGTTTDYVLNNSTFIRERRNGSNVATYLMGARGPEYRRDDAAGTVQWYLYDGLGSVTGEVAPNGTVTSSRKFDVYGVVRGGTNPGGTTKHKFVGKLGHPSEDETGLIYMQARYMDPAAGRFASEDPARNGRNWFAYVSNNPVGRIDRDGMIDGAVSVLEAEVDYGKAVVSSGFGALASILVIIAGYQAVQTLATIGVFMATQKHKPLGNNQAENKQYYRWGRERGLSDDVIRALHQAGITTRHGLTEEEIKDTMDKVSQELGGDG